MNGSRTGTWATALLLALAVAAAFGLGTVLRHALPLGPAMAHAEETAADAQYEGPWAVAERQITDNEERGAIRVGEEVVLEIQTVAGGLTGYERALIVSKRLNDALAAGIKPNQIHSAQTAGMYVVQAGPTTLITVTNPEAERQKTTPAQLAALWAQSLARALGGEPGPAVVPTTTPGETETTPLETDWTPPEPYKDKLVPIISVLQGIKVGVARVNGPTSKVDQVQAVAQLETDFRKVLTINIYVPISTEVPGQKLARVQGVGLTGVADIRIRL